MEGFVAFDSRASNLDPRHPATVGTNDIFVHDRQTGETTWVSVASDGSGANASSLFPAISGDGNVVAFDSVADNLDSAQADTNGENDVFVHDRQTGETTRVSVASDGTQGNSDSGQPTLSYDGRFVAFHSLADNLVPGGNHGVFVHDRQTGETTLVSVAADGTQACCGFIRDPSISDDGRFVAFWSGADNLLPAGEDTNSSNDVFVHDRPTGETRRASVASDGTEGSNDSREARISADGRAVAFESVATNLAEAGDINGLSDVFVAAAPVEDFDDDSILDPDDNCPNTANPTQDDSDGDGVGDACAVIGMTDLGTLGGAESTAAGINESGEVVGRSQIGTGEVHAFLWTAQTGMQDLGTLGGAVSEAFDINDAGQIVGSSETASGETHAFLWEGGVMQDLGTLGHDFTTSVATGINNLGHVAGYSVTATYSRAFLWTPAGGMQDLGTLGGDSAIARDINDFDQVVGRSEVAPLMPHAFLWEAGVMQDLGNIFAGQPIVEALGINNDCQIVGWSVADGDSGAWIVTPEDSDGDGRPDLWNRDDDGMFGNDLMQDLGKLAVAGNTQIAFGINDAGRAVGGADPAVPGPSLTLHASRWTSDRCGWAPGRHAGSSSRTRVTSR